MTPKIYYLVLALVCIIGCKDSGLQQGTAPGQQPDHPAVESEKSGVPTEQGKTNRPPLISAIDMTPLYPKTGDTIKIKTTASDPDGDTVKLIYQWTHNDAALKEESDTLNLATGFKHGDRIALTVIPDDGLVKGSPARITVTIANSPPEIISSPSDNRLSNRIFTYQAKAVDKDNDPLIYSLKAAPSDMAIDPAKGSVQWNIPPEFEGKASITVSVTDGQGGETMQSFALEIAPGKPKEK